MGRSNNSNIRALIHCPIILEAAKMGGLWLRPVLVVSYRADQGQRNMEYWKVH